MTPKRPLERCWRVMRLDANRNQFVVARDMCEEEARALVAQLMGRAHQQEYLAEPMPVLRVHTG